ncbi:hypothetical protein LTR56_010364 [Elasticomyces elasticus]|nr:hypothetical protein LTR56_010364 [Elasticomyces elasticus]KAK3656932.1 hypothetical protein LTR22_009594 [Elasticomyces elasticus]KAK4926065.1 hypothetical protein LTR49_006980 [Elasticomyces elasticus]KAK5766164.1 hypothetical protein LTS12_003647 [Elasticomyces elasticus]
MAAYSTGASWGFQDLPGNDTPGGWTQDDVDEQIHAETKTEEPDIKTKEHSPPPPQQPHPRTHWPSRTCRICLEVVEPTLHTDDATPNIVPEALRPAPRVTYESPPGDGGRLLRPCHCKGSQKWVGSTLSQIALTVLIFVTGMFVLGFVADPIINLYLDPVSTIYTRGGPGGSLLFEDEPATWGEHFLKGFASIGLLGFAKFLLTLSPWHWFNMRGTGIAVHRSGGVGGNGRDRLAGLNWLAVIVGVATVMWAVWKMVRSFSRRVLEKAGENVMDVPATEGEEDDD